MFDETPTSSACYVKVSRTPDDLHGLIAMVDALPGANGYPVKGKYI